MPPPPVTSRSTAMTAAAISQKISVTSTLFHLDSRHEDAHLGDSGPLGHSAYIYWALAMSQELSQAVGIE